MFMPQKLLIMGTHAYTVIPVKELIKLFSFDVFLLSCLIKEPHMKKNHIMSRIFVTAMIKKGYLDLWSMKENTKDARKTRHFFFTS